MKFPNLHIVWTAEDETSPRLQCKYAIKTDVEQSQIKNLQLSPLCLDCQDNHYEVELLGTSTIKPISYTPWIKKLHSKNHSNKNYIKKCILLNREKKCHW